LIGEVSDEATYGVHLSDPALGRTIRWLHSAAGVVCVGHVG
jgi:hypothetical protein